MCHYRGKKREDVRFFFSCCMIKVSRFSMCLFCCCALCLLFRICACASVWTALNYSAKPTHSHIRCPPQCGAQASLSARLSFPIGCGVPGSRLTNLGKVKCLVNCRPLLWNVLHRLDLSASSTAAGFCIFLLCKLNKVFALLDVALCQSSVLRVQ